MEIDVARLRQITNELLLRLEQSGTRQVELTSDYFWEIPSKLRYDNADEPCEFEMGQLSEELAFVNEMLDGTRPPVTFGLVWVSSLLRYIGEKIIE